ncbi:MAG TPA: ABC transporter ATP-binding protein [Solirubrobacteraceae bacterium]|jgi:ABC-2 type transport system ATP-binding protein
MRDTPIVVVEQLHKRYRVACNSISAVCDLSFEIAAGEALVLLGANGAGKSTTVSIIATLLKPDAGLVLVAGADVVQRPDAARRCLGVALQIAGLPRRQTARRLLHHHARLHGMSASDTRSRVAEVIERFDLGAIADRSISTYSGGQRQRLHIALALIHHPLVALLDEPTTGLDTRSRQIVWTELRAQLAAGTTLLFTTHDLHEAEANAHRVAIISRGTLVAHRHTEDLKRELGSRTVTLSFMNRREAQRALELVGRGELSNGSEAKLALVGERDALDVIRLLAAHEVDINTISIVEPTLESIFNQLTSEQHPPVTAERQL